MTTRIQDHEAVRADPVGFVWTLMLALALVAVIGLIAYLVFKGDVAPAARLTANPAAASIQAPPAPLPR